LKLSSNGINNGRYKDYPKMFIQHAILGQNLMNINMSSIAVPFGRGVARGVHWGPGPPVQKSKTHTKFYENFRRPHFARPRYLLI